eukprot:7391282-Prymnesium_polylepis.1
MRRNSKEQGAKQAIVRVLGSIPVGRTPIGQTAIITSAVWRVVEYSSVSHDRAKSSCRKRWVSPSPWSYSNTSHRNVLKMRVAVLGTRTKESTR